MPLPHDAVAAQRSTPGWAKSNTRVLAINAAWPHSTFKVGISLTSDLPLRTLLHLLFFHFWVQSTPHPLLGGLPLSGLEYLFPDSPCSACLPSAGGRGGRGDLKAPPGFTLLRRGASPGLLKELGWAAADVLHNMLSSGFPLNKLCKGGKGGKRGFYGPWAHVSTEGPEGKQLVFEEHPKTFVLSCWMLVGQSPSCLAAPPRRL